MIHPQHRFIPSTVFLCLFAAAAVSPIPEERAAVEKDLTALEARKEQAENLYRLTEDFKRSSSNF